MQLFCVLFLLFFVGTKAFEEDNVFKIPLEHHFVSKEVLMARQNTRLSKLGIQKGSLPRYHQKLLESTFPNDYITMNLSLGTPKQDFRVIVNTGGTRLWILDKEYANKSSSQHVYNSRNSSTSKNMNKDFSETDGSFTSFGKYYYDFLQIGPIKVKSQAFGSIQKIENKDGDSFLFPVDGAIGLFHLIDSVYKSGSEPTAPIDNLLQTLLKIVTIYFGPSLPDASPNSGQVTFNGFDDKHCDRDKWVTEPFVASKNDNRYIINIVKFYTGYLSKYYNGTAYVDSSISSIIMPSSALKETLSKMLASYNYDIGMYTLPCDKSPSGLSFDVSTGGTLYIYSRNYFVDIGLSDGTCVLALEVSDETYKEDFVFGTPLLQSYCIEYDFDNRKIGFYEHK